MEYKQEPCTFRFLVSSVEKVVDGDTVDVIIDLGFDILTRQRVRLLGIDTPESRTSDPEEKKYGLLSKKQLKQWLDKERYEHVEIRCQERDSRGKFGRVLGEVWVCVGGPEGAWINVNQWMCENFFAVPYVGQNKSEVEELHLQNRQRVQSQLLTSAAED